MDTPQKKQKKKKKKKKSTPTTTAEPDINLPTVHPPPSPTTTQQPFHQRVRPTALSVDPPSPTHRDMDQAMNQMLERIIDLEQRLAASTTNYLQQVDTPVITPRIKAYQPCQTPSLSVRRPTTGTGLTPPPSPKPEEVANALSDSPATFDQTTDTRLHRRRHHGGGGGGGENQTQPTRSSSQPSESSTTTATRFAATNIAGAADDSFSSSSSASMSLLDYAQLPFRDGPMPYTSSSKDEGAERLRMLRLVRVPYYVECMVNYGFAVALDSFLFYLTILPLRALYALLLVVSSICSSKARRAIHGRHLHDLLQILIFVVCTTMLTQVDMSRAYHTLRAQSFLKLYVIFNLFDILDKLFCALGQGIFDSLRWTLENHPEGTSVLHHGSQIIAFSIAAVVYTFFHALLSFCRMVALNVAINTEGSSLLTLLISNNFVELKASVFKRFQPENLFQITCSDIVERVHLFIFMGLIGLQNLDKVEDRDVFMWAAPIILGCEVLVDWVKHCFVSNFNRIPVDVYLKSAAVLRHDLTSGISGGIQNFSGRATRNHAYTVANRIGLVNLPLAVFVVRVLLTQFTRMEYTRWQLCAVAAMSFLILLAFKILLGLCLMTHAAWEFNRKERAAASASNMSTDEQVRIDRHCCYVCWTGVVLFFHSFFEC